MPSLTDRNCQTTRAQLDVRTESPDDDGKSFMPEAIRYTSPYTYWLDN